MSSIESGHYPTFPVGVSARFRIPIPKRSVKIAFESNDICMQSSDDTQQQSDNHRAPSSSSLEYITITHDLDASNCKEYILGMERGVEPCKPEAGDYSYSGMHDHGLLVRPVEGGDFALLIGCVHEAKRLSDELLTRVIEEEREMIQHKKRAIED